MRFGELPFTEPKLEYEINAITGSILKRLTA